MTSAKFVHFLIPPRSPLSLSESRNLPSIRSTALGTPSPGPFQCRRPLSIAHLCGRGRGRRKRTGWSSVVSAEPFKSCNDPHDSFSTEYLYLYTCCSFDTLANYESNRRRDRTEPTNLEPRRRQAFRVPRRNKPPRTPPPTPPSSSSSSSSAAPLLRRHFWSRQHRREGRNTLGTVGTIERTNEGRRGGRKEGTNSAKPTNRPAAACCCLP